jgi:hypothetical protein
MPKKFTNGEDSTPQDYEKGYKWLNNEDHEHKAVVWAYENEPVEPEAFRLSDTRMAHNLELVARSIAH